MSKESSIKLGQIKSAFTKQPLPDKFSRVVAVLLSYTNRDTYCCRPSKARIANHIGCSEKTVARNLRAVKELGLFHCQTLGREQMRHALGNGFKSKSTGQRLFTLYRLNESQGYMRRLQILRMSRPQFERVAAELRR